MSPPASVAVRDLAGWLQHCDALHRVSMDLSLERTLEVKRRLNLQFDVPVIVVAGTNGKGSTCAMLEAVARAAGWRTGLYQKPELVHFEERCRVDGTPVAASTLLPHFEAVEAARGEITLTKFEFTTLAIARCLAHQPIDVAILEVGLGGRFDAVNAFDGDCAVITSIDIDHVDFLGPDRESIGREKAGIMRPGRPVVVCDPAVPNSVLDEAQRVGADLRLIGRDFQFSGDRQQWNWAGREKRFNALAYPALRGANQLLNASGVLATFEALWNRLPVTAQAVRTGLATVELPGRFQVIAGQPALVLDVAHNPHAASALALNLDQMGYFPRTHAVFGAMRDKDIAGILQRLSPLVDEWHFTDLPIGRAAKAEDLASVLGELWPRSRGPVAAHCHGAPDHALRAALERAEPTDRIVVFGSFYTVGGVLRQGLPKLQARHTA